MKKNQLIFSLAFSLITGLTVYLILKNDEKKIAIVDAVKLFNEYDMKKELENEAKGRLQYLGHRLDSMEQEYKMNQSLPEAAKQIAQSYQQLKTLLDNEYAASNQSINEQVWKRLNPLVTQYGREKHLHVIIGANGMGTVMYNDETFDLTEDLIKYVNKAYANAR